MASASVSPAYAALESGETAPDASPRRGGDAPPTERAWRCACDALVGLGARALEAAPPERSHETALPLALACAHLAAHAATTFDEGLAQGVGALLGSLPTASDDAAACDAARGWIAWMRGEPFADDTLARAERVARAAGRPTLLVQLGALRAALLDAAGDGDAMLPTARRVSRMARAEGVARAECLAHLVLARARRRAGHPHLAIRILAALATVTPPELEGWLHLERQLAGDVGAEASASADPASLAAARLTDALSSARAGRREELARSLDRMHEAARGVLPIASELSELAAALDSTRTPPPALAGWARGDDALAPPAVRGLAVRAIDESDDVGEAAVLVRPGERGRRLLGLAAAIALAEGDVRLHRRSRMRQGRIETLLAVLACAGPEGLDEALVFERTYELAYHPPIHRGVLDVLITRTRAALDGHGDVVRRTSRLALTLEGPALFPDPRCSARTHDRLLRALARAGRASADDVARELGVSVRSAQDALKTLAAEGACIADREGRQLVYAVEDTTFSEATAQLARRRSPR
ncbi:MAG: hypothetical protein U0234_04325 [Sandaracinus sp.]